MLLLTPPRRIDVTRPYTELLTLKQEWENVGKLSQNTEREAIPLSQLDHALPETRERPIRMRENAKW